PSLHVGWNLLAGLVLFNSLRGSLLRFLPLISPVMMTMAVVFTANHYVVDVIAGAVVALGGLYAAKRTTDWIERRALESEIRVGVGPPR
ncbi:MAG: phosphatase PAP2 family protein, partial [Acidimicrobiales bacterium]